MSEEEIAAEFLQQRDFSTQRFTKKERRQSKTPDFRVYAGGSFEFYCEVKSTRDDSLDAVLAKAPAGTVVGGARHDPVFNRISTHIHEAVKQFDAVNPDAKYPNVLIFVNHDEMSGYDDLASAITGDFIADDGARYPIYRMVSEGRIKDEKFRVHLYVWIEAETQTPKNLIFNKAHEAHLRTLCKYFGADPSELLDA